MNKKLIEIIKKFSTCRIGVIGDLVADEYILGMTSRVSREAPVLILKYDSQTLLPGGAGNAVCNINSLGGQVFPVGVVGDDANGDSLIKYMEDAGIDSTGIIKDPDRVTSTKTRILAGGAHTAKQQVIRIDKENEQREDKKIEEKIVSLLEEKISTFDALLVSDYSLGTISSAIFDIINSIASQKKIIVAVDSRHNILRFKNITAVTPNTEELDWMSAALKQEGGVEGRCRDLLHRINSEAVLLTKGQEGMTLYEAAGRTTDIDIYGTDEVADVTGAGDTVISAFTLALATKAKMNDAARIANYAGGIVVMKSGTAMVTSSELEKAMANDQDKKTA